MRATLRAGIRECHRELTNAAILLAVFNRMIELLEQIANRFGAGPAVLGQMKAADVDANLQASGEIRCPADALVGGLFITTDGGSK